MGLLFEAGPLFDRYQSAKRGQANGLFECLSSKIQRTFCLFHGPAWHAVGVNHCRPHVGMAQQCLNRADIIIRLQKMGSKTTGAIFGSVREMAR